MKIEITNSAGEHVRALALHNVSPGPGTVTWDGRNDAGRDVAPGVYRATLSAGGSTQTVKLVRTP